MFTIACFPSLTPPPKPFYLHIFCLIHRLSKNLFWIMQTCSHRQPSAPTPPLLPDEKCNLPRGGGRVLGSFSCAYTGYLSNYYSAKPQFTTDFMSRLRLKMSDKQNVLCCPPRGVCLCVLHMQKKQKKTSINAGYDPLYLDLQFLLIVSSQPLWT